MHHVLAIKGVEIEEDRVLFAKLQKNQQLWHYHNRISHVWAFFVLNDLVAKVHNHLIQSMRCILFDPMALTSSSSSTTRLKKIIFSYNPAHGITSMKKYVENEHGATMNQYKKQKKLVDENIDGGQEKEENNASQLHH
jgi:hypothetical protein